MCLINHLCSYDGTVLMSVMRTGEAAGLWRWHPGIGGCRRIKLTLGRCVRRLWLCVVAPFSPSGRGSEVPHDDSCLSSISFITVGSARLRVAFRTKPISLFIALGFPFFRSITFQDRNCFRGENIDSYLNILNEGLYLLKFKLFLFV